MTIPSWCLPAIFMSLLALAIIWLAVDIDRRGR